MKQRKKSRKNFQDNFNNFAARLGLDANSILGKGGYTPGLNITLNPMELDDMYENCWIVGRMVDVVAADMIRGWVEIQSEMEPGEIDDLRRYTRQMGVQARLLDALKWARLYGGALAIILIDGQDLADPLNYDTISPGSFRGLYVLDRWRLVPSVETIPVLGPMLGYPEYYTINSMDALQGQRIHYTRAVRFAGVELPYEKRIANEHWGASVVSRAYDRILALDSATHGAANLLFRSYLRIIGVDSYRQILAQGGAPLRGLRNMLELFNTMQSNEGLGVIDKEDTFTTHSWNFTGVYEALQAFCEQIAGATGIPLVRLLGQSPKGFSSGESDMQTYYDTILTQQEDGLRPALEVLFNVLSRGLWGRPLPEGFAFEFKSLWQPTELEKAQIASLDASNVGSLYSAGIIDRSDALTELRDSGRITGKYNGITDEDIVKAREEEAAPPLPEGIELLEVPPNDNSGQAENL